MGSPLTKVQRWNSFIPLASCMIDLINGGTFDPCWYRIGFKRATFYKFRTGLPRWIPFFVL